MALCVFFSLFFFAGTRGEWTLLDVFGGNGVGSKESLLCKEASTRSEPDEDQIGKNRTLNSEIQSVAACSLGILRE
jgi:hypothetical protein